MTFEVRSMRKEDVPACVVIINHIIALGGSTAREAPYDTTEFATLHLEKYAISNVVLDNDRIVGFQGALNVGDNVFSIATFTDRSNPAKGAGRAIFAKTVADARALQGNAIIARITSDNHGGLAYYTKIGFIDHAIEANDMTRKDGTVVDRIVKRFAL